LFEFIPKLTNFVSLWKDVAAALSALTDCLDLSEEINAKDGGSWEVEAEKGASDLDLLTQYVKSEMKAVRDKAESEEFNGGFYDQADDECIATLTCIQSSVTGYFLG
jgi:hypothetical protein